jgi:hypothetical protein
MGDRPFEKLRTKGSAGAHFGVAQYRLRLSGSAC